MSVDLTVKLVRTVPYREVLDLTAINLKRILQVDAGISVSNRSNISQSVDIGLSDFDDLIYLENYPDDIVEVGTSYLLTTPSYEDADYDGWSMYVTIRAAYESPAKYALFFAFVAAVSKHQNMPVLDDSGVIGNGVDKYWADALISLVSLQQPQINLKEALQNYSEYMKLTFST